MGDISVGMPLNLALKLGLIRRLRDLGYEVCEEVMDPQSMEMQVSIDAKQTIEFLQERIKRLENDNCTLLSKVREYEAENDELVEKLHGRTVTAPVISSCASLSRNGTRCMMPMAHGGLHNDGIGKKWIDSQALPPVWSILISKGVKEAGWWWHGRPGSVDETSWAPVFVDKDGFMARDGATRLVDENDNFEGPAQGNPDKQYDEDF